LVVLAVLVIAAIITVVALLAKPLPEALIIPTPTLGMLTQISPDPTSPGVPDYEATSIFLLTNTAPITPVRPTGIFDDQTDFFHEGYRMQNAWQGVVAGFWANVVAGAHSDDPEQGWIFSSWEWPNAAVYGFYKTPSRTGAVHVVAEQDARLTLVSANGVTYYWDIPSQSFVDSLTVPASTITPPPTYTPTPDILPPPAQTQPEGYPASTPPSTDEASGYPGLTSTPAP
jgi:hypothetical protein